MKFNRLTSKRMAAIISLLLCMILYLSSLSVFSKSQDTYICYIDKKEGTFHIPECAYAGKNAFESTMYEAQKHYSHCICRPSIYDERYKVTITVRDYVTPLIISVPASITVYVLLTIGKKKPESTG